MYRAPAAVLDRVESFLGVPAWRPSDFGRFNSGAYPPMASQTRRALEAYFAPSNEELRSLVGAEFTW